MTDHFIPNHKLAFPIYIYKQPYNKIRRAKLILFEHFLEQYVGFSSNTNEYKLKILIKLERGCFNHSIDMSYNLNIITSWEYDTFCDLYSSICSKLVANLDPEGPVRNISLAKKIINMNINFTQLPKMSSVNLFPEKYEKINARLEACKHVKSNIKTTSMYTCGKCYEKKCTLKNVINRSLDEGTSIEATCVNCGFSFQV